MQKFVQFIPFAFLLTSFFLSLFTITSPTITFKEQVSLMKLSGNVSIASNTTTSKGSALLLNLSTIQVAGSNEKTRRSIAGTRMMKKSKRELNEMMQVLASNNATTGANLTVTTSTAVSKNITSIPGSILPSTPVVSTLLLIGLTGACYRVPTFNGSSLTNLNCTAASPTPMWTPLFNILSLPSALQTALPDQFPLAPSVIILAAGLLAFASLLSLMVALMPITNKARADKQIAIRKFALCLGAGSLTAILAATIAVRIELGRFTTEFNVASAKLNGELLFSKAELGSGFIQLYSAAVIEVVGLMLMAFIK